MYRNILRPLRILSQPTVSKLSRLSILGIQYPQPTETTKLCSISKEKS